MFFFASVLPQDKTASRAKSSTTATPTPPTPVDDGTEFSSMVQMTLAFHAWWTQQSQRLFRGKHQRRKLLRQIGRIVLGAAAATVLYSFIYSNHITVFLFVCLASPKCFHCSHYYCCSLFFIFFHLAPLFFFLLGRLSVHGDRRSTCSCARAPLASTLYV